MAALPAPPFPLACMKPLVLLAAACLAAPAAMAQSFAAMQWLNAPKQVRRTPTTLQVQVQGGTDFWRVTHYGFIRDNGHFLYQE